MKKMNPLSLAGQKLGSIKTPKKALASASNGLRQKKAAVDSTLCRKTPLRAKSAPRKGELKQKPRKQLGAGKRMKEWAAVWRRLKPIFEEAGITACEMGGDGCWHQNGLTPGHSKKRRNIVGDEIEEIAILCIPCHEAADLMPEREMTELIRGIIARRDPLFERLKAARKAG